MKFDEFSQSLKESHPPAQYSETLQSLWHAKKENWDRAHQIVQDLSSREAAWVHAYLHRVEGDISNADYWYSRSGHSRSKLTLDEEWMEIVKALLH